jgi:hypothetical protein
MVGQLLMLPVRSTEAAWFGTADLLTRVGAQVAGRLFGRPEHLGEDMRSGSLLDEADGRWPWWAEDVFGVEDVTSTWTDRPYWVAAPGGPWGPC